jgi:hypothetical protein
MKEEHPFYNFISMIKMSQMNLKPPKTLAKPYKCPPSLERKKVEKGEEKKKKKIQEKKKRNINKKYKCRDSRA